MSSMDCSRAPHTPTARISGGYRTIGIRGRIGHAPLYVHNRTLPPGVGRFGTYLLWITLPGASAFSMPFGSTIDDVG
jgi:hypothetical protein